MSALVVGEVVSVLDVIRSPVARVKYGRDLKRFLLFCGFQGSLDGMSAEFVARCRGDVGFAERSVLLYLRMLKARFESKEIAPSTVGAYLRPVKVLCEMNDVTVNWGKVNRMLPSLRKAAYDRAYQVEEIRELLNDDDHRLRIAVLLMSGSGIRVGAFD